MTLIDIPVYLQVEPRQRGYNRETSRFDGDVSDAAAVGYTVKRPGKPRGGTVTVKITLRMDSRSFDPLRPEAVVIIPADLSEAHPIVVEAIDPREEPS